MFNMEQIARKITLHEAFDFEMNEKCSEVNAENLFNKQRDIKKEI